MHLALHRCYAEADPRWQDVEHVGLLSLAAHAREHLDGITYTYCHTPEEMLVTEADVYCLSSVTASWNACKALAERLVADGKKVVIGGYHITCLPEHLPRECVAVLGEGERSTLGLLRAWQEGRDTLGLPGTAQWLGGNLAKGPPMPRLDLKQCDHLPIGSPGDGGYMAIATRGCPWKCWFCCASRHWLVPGCQAVTRFRPEYVARKLAEACAGREDSAVTFHDLNFASSPTWTRRFVAAAKQYGAPDDWHVRGCSFTAAIANEDVIRALKSIGVQWLGIGIESASPWLFRKLKPHLTMDDNVRLLELGQKLEVQVRASFILGTPGETEEDLAATRDFIGQWSGQWFKQGGLFMYVPYPGTPGWYELLEQGRVSPDMDMATFRNGGHPAGRECAYFNEENVPYDKLVEWWDAISAVSKVR